MKCAVETSTPATFAVAIVHRLRPSCIQSPSLSLPDPFRRSGKVERLFSWIHFGSGSSGHGSQQLIDESLSSLLRRERMRELIVARAGGQVKALVEFVAAGQCAADEIPGEAENSRAISRI